jgi:DNA primase
MHVLVPVERRYTYDDTRQFAEIVAGAIARTNRGWRRPSGRSRSGAAC